MGGWFLLLSFFSYLLVALKGHQENRSPLWGSTKMTSVNFQPGAGWRGFPLEDQLSGL